MEISIALIRNGHTRSSGTGRLLGMTDEPLSGYGGELVRAKKQDGTYPKATMVFSSDLERCFTTAQIIFPGIPVIMEKGLRAPDYGEFNGMEYKDIVRDKRFADWANPQHVPPCPGGEEPYAIQARSVAAFRRICGELSGKGIKNAAVITHKTVIQAILQRFHEPRSNYINWEVPYGGGYLLIYDTATSSVDIAGKIG